MTSPHFAWLPPEINSALLFAGPGTAPLLAAATAWEGLAEDLASSASSFLSVTTELASGSWQGTSAMAMLSVATQYAGWLSAAAAQAEIAASQATAIAGAFEAALAATVQPAVVTANRMLVQVLANTNWFGLNAPAIMDTEAAYEQMWAADVAAMFNYYVDASAAVGQLPPWEQVLQKFGFEFSNGQLSSILPDSHGQGWNVGFGNSGSQNVGSGNTGSNNLGWGNLGNGTIGFGNTGNNDFGVGLTGSNQIGFGGFNSGTGNIGLFNSGNNNIGFFNSGNGNLGIGNAGSFNTGFANSGSMNMGFFNNGAANTGFFQDTVLGAQTSPDASLLSSGRYVTGGLGPADVGSHLLGPAAANTGGLSMSLGNASPLNPAAAHAAFAEPVSPPAAVAGGVESLGGNPAAVTAIGGPTPTVGVRTAATAPTGVFNPPTGDPGVRSNPPVREPGIPNSGFFSKADRTPAGPNPGIREPSPLD